MQGPDDGRHVHVARPEGAVHPVPHPLAVGQLAVLDPPGQAGVDVLEMDVGDPLRGLAGQLGRVGAADQQVPGVQAQVDRGALKDPLDLGAVLDHGADVGVQHRPDPPARRQGG